MKYDAFISYRHGGLDGMVAERLHKLLETYRVPKAIAKKTGKKSIKRVFRDREELPTSSDLSGSINDALENSEFLLLICSPRLLQSKWCMQEVDRFGELHGKDRIIALLIEGEPDESFPKTISQRLIDGKIVDVEPLAADIRAKTAKESLKILNTEKLRLLAPVLGCGYDDLKQRHRARKIRRLVTGVSAAFAFSLAFGSFSTYQYLQINKQMKLKLENQSHVLAGYSAETLANGDPEVAALLAIEGLPKSLTRPERPFVRAAEKSLADALGVYDMTSGFKPYKSITLPAAPGQVKLSPSGKFAAVNYTFELVIVNSETGEIITTLQTEKSALADTEFISDDIIIYAREGGIAAYDISSKTEIWSGNKTTGIAISQDKNIIAATYKNENKAYIYDKNGAIISEIGFGDRHCPVPVNDTFLNPKDFIFELNSDGTLLAVSFSDGSMSIFNTDGEIVETVLFEESNAIHFEGGFSGNLFAVSVVEHEPYAASYMIVDVSKWEVTLELSSQNTHFVTFMSEDKVLCANGSQVIEVDKNGEDYKIIASISDRIINIAQSENTLFIADNSGNYHFVSDNGMKTYTSDSACDFIDICSDYALTGSYDSGFIRILKRSENMGELIYSHENDLDYTEVKRSESTENVVFYSYLGLNLFDKNGTLIKEQMFPLPDSVIDTQYDKASGNVIVIYENKVLIYSGKDGSLLLERSDMSSVKFTPFGVHVLSKNGAFELIDTGTASAIKTESISANKAVYLGKLLYNKEDEIYFGEESLGEYSFIGGEHIGEESYIFAVADSESGKVYKYEKGSLKHQFDFTVRGYTEAYFAGEYTFLSELRGVATVYDSKGNVVTTLSEDGYLAETETFGENILAHFVSTSSGRYTLSLGGENLEVAAYLPKLMGTTENGSLIFAGGNGQLYQGKLYTSGELIEFAENMLHTRTLTDEERINYRVG